LGKKSFFLGPAAAIRACVKGKRRADEVADINRRKTKEEKKSREKKNARRARFN